MKFILIILLAGLSACQQSETITPNLEVTGTKPYWSARISTLNVWGLPFKSQYKSERMSAIVQAINLRNPNFVFIQEAWTSQVRDSLAKNTRLSSNESFNKSGLMFLSESPLLKTSFRQFTLLGRLVDIFEGDAWSGKGIGISTTILQGAPVSMFNTHLVARYEDQDKPEDKSTLDRLTELFEVFVSVVEESSSHLFIIAGDFNFRPAHTEYIFWKELTGLDGLLLEEKDKFYCTYCRDNSFNDESEGQLDYIFVTPYFKIVKGVIDYTEQIQVDDKFMNLSDHYGLTAEIRLERTRKDSKLVRQLMLKNIIELRNRVETSLGINEIVQKGFSDQICRSCNLRTISKKLKSYIDVLEGRSNDRWLTEKINKYLELF